MQKLYDGKKCHNINGIGIIRQAGHLRTPEAGAPWVGYEACDRFARYNALDPDVIFLKPTRYFGNIIVPGICNFAYCRGKRIGFMQQIERSFNELIFLHCEHGPALPEIINILGVHPVEAVQHGKQRGHIITSRNEKPAYIAAPQPRVCENIACKASKLIFAFAACKDGYGCPAAAKYCRKVAVFAAEITVGIVAARGYYCVDRLICILKY